MSENLVCSEGEGEGEGRVRACMSKVLVSREGRGKAVYEHE